MSMYERAMIKIQQDTAAIQAVPEDDHYQNECKPIEDRRYFDLQHNAAPRDEQLAEEDRLNLEALKGNYGEMDSFVNTFWRDESNADDVLYQAIQENTKAPSERDYAEIGRRLCESLVAPVESYLSMVRKS